MCTCIAYKNKDFYFEEILILTALSGTGSGHSKKFLSGIRNTEWEKRHYAMIGMASADDRVSAVRGSGQ